MLWSDVISHARLFLSFFADQPWNPWHMLVELLGFVEPWLKITGLENMLLRHAFSGPQALIRAADLA